MSKIYCPTCAKPNLYSFDKPKFCGHCGSGFSVGFTTTAATTTPTQPKPSAIHVVRRIEPEIEEIPELTSLSYTKSISESRGIKFEDVMKQQKTGFDRRGGRSFSKEDILGELKESAKRTVIEDESLPLNDVED